MATNEIQMTESTIDVAAAQIFVVDFSNWVEVDSDIVDAKKGSRETVYQHISAPSDRPMRLRIGSYPNGKEGAEAVFNQSVRMTYWNKYTDDNSEISYEEDSAVIAFTTKRQPNHLAADKMEFLVSNLFSVLMGNVAVGVPDWDGLDRLSRGITNFAISGITRT